MTNITPDQFYNFLMNNINKYDQNVQKVIRQETDDVSKQIAPELESYSRPKPRWTLIKNWCL